MSNKSRLEANNTNLQSVLQAVQGLLNVDDVKHGVYVWKRLSAQGGTFLDFVVSDNASAYPDGGTQGGYWYEKVVEGKAGIDFGEITFTTYFRTVQFSHNLNAVPKYVFLIPKSVPFESYMHTGGIFSTEFIQGYLRGWETSFAANSSSVSASPETTARFLTSLTSTEITMTFNSDVAKGTYFLIVVA